MAGIYLNQNHLVHIRQPKDTGMMSPGDEMKLQNREKIRLLTPKILPL